VLVSATPDTVRPLGLDTDTELLQEGADLEKSFSDNTDGRLPPGTHPLRSSSGVTNGECRFTCHEEPLCSAYKWTGSTNKCVLLQAPNHLVSQTANTRWHEGASQILHTGYESSAIRNSAKALDYAESLEKEDDPKRGRLDLSKAVDKAIEKTNAWTHLAVAKAKNPEEEQFAELVGNYKKQQIKLFDSQNRIKYKKALEVRLQYASIEKAKEVLRQPKKMQEMKSSKWIHLPTMLAAETDKARERLKGHIARKVERQFNDEMERFVINKDANFETKALKKEEAVAQAQIDKTKAAAKAHMDKEAKIATKQNAKEINKEP